MTKLELQGWCRNKRAATCRTGCRAMVRLLRTSDHGWYISRVDNHHNHPCSQTYGENKQWPSHSEIDPMTKEFIQKLRENNIPIGRVCSILGVHGNQSERDSKISVRKVFFLKGAIDTVFIKQKESFTN